MIDSFLSAPTPSIAGLDPNSTSSCSVPRILLKTRSGFGSHPGNPVSRRFLPLILLLVPLLAVALLLGSCSSSSSMAPAKEAADLASDVNNQDSGGSESVNEEVSAAAVERKIIRNASLDLTVTDVVAAYDQILAYVEQRKGYESDRNQTVSNDVTVIYATIKIDPTELDGLIEFTKSLGDLVNCTISTEDITEDYYDTQTRLETMEKTLDQYYGYLEDSATIEETLMVQNQIDGLTVEIESLKGKLRLWENLLDESVVELQLRQYTDPVRIKKDIDWNTLSLADMGYLIRSGLVSVLNVLAGTGQWLLIVAVAAAPIWIPILIIVLIVIRHKRKRRLAMRAGQAQQAQQTPYPPLPLMPEPPQTPQPPQPPQTPQQPPQEP